MTPVFPVIDQAALSALCERMKENPADALVVRPLAPGGVKVQGGKLSPAALALAEKVRAAAEKIPAKAAATTLGKK